MGDCEFQQWRSTFDDEITGDPDGFRLVGEGSMLSFDLGEEESYIETGFVVSVGFLSGE